jgi:hypothetical protein
MPERQDNFATRTDESIMFKEHSGHTMTGMTIFIFVFLKYNKNVNLLHTQ